MLLGDALLVGNLVLLGCNEGVVDGLILILGVMLGSELADGLKLVEGFSDGLSLSEGACEVEGIADGISENVGDNDVVGVETNCLLVVRVAVAFPWFTDFKHKSGEV